MQLFDGMPIATVADLDKASQMARDSFKQYAWFRGQVDRPNYRLLPGAFRDGSSRKREANRMGIYQALATSRREECPAPENHIGWLTLMQHHRLQTRLLDWTESILIATFFAVEENFSDEDPSRCIWALNTRRLNELAGWTNRPLISHTEEAVKVLVAAAFQPAKESMRPLAVQTPQIDPRMQVQQAQFTLHGSDTVLEDTPDSDTFLMKFTIAPDNVKSVREGLQRCGIDRHTLFPDLENLATWVNKLGSI